MKKGICILSVLAILLCAWLVLLWLPALTHEGKPQSETRYGLSEGLQLVEQTFADKKKRYVIEDGEGNVVFDVPLRGCIFDTRFRGGRLRFREQQSGREGYIDRQGIVTLLHEGEASIPEEVATGRTTRFAASAMTPAQQLQGTAAAPSPGEGGGKPSAAARRNQSIAQVSLKSIVKDDPFFKEASKIMQGKLTEQDAKRRHTILNYCEHLRTAYTTKDIDFLRQVCRRPVCSGRASELRHPIEARIHSAPRQGVFHEQQGRCKVLRLPHPAPPHDGRHLWRHAAAAV